MSVYVYIGVLTCMYSNIELGGS